MAAHFQHEKRCRQDGGDRQVAFQRALFARMVHMVMAAAFTGRRHLAVAVVMPLVPVVGLMGGMVVRLWRRQCKAGKFRRFHQRVLPVKPDPTLLRRLMEELGASPADTLFVGDSNVDIRTAKNGGLAGCGIDSGVNGGCDGFQNGLQPRRIRVAVQTFDGKFMPIRCNIVTHLLDGSAKRFG